MYEDLIPTLQLHVQLCIQLYNSLFFPFNSNDILICPAHDFAADRIGVLRGEGLLFGVFPRRALFNACKPGVCDRT